MTKQYRELSGIYFRQQNPDTGKWENICFEECSPAKQQEIMDTATPEFLKSLTQGLAGTIVRLGNQFDLTTNP